MIYDMKIPSHVDTALQTSFPGKKDNFKRNIFFSFPQVYWFYHLLTRDIKNAVKNLQRTT